jgi:uncharacterized membrane protein YphA (DoxX/SURF4 family)
MQPPVTNARRHRALPSPGVLRGLTALVWLYQGVWLKLLLASKDQVAVVAAVPGFSGPAAGAAIAAIGVIEAAVALWVLSGLRPIAAALFQTALLLGMNAAGIIFAQHAIHDPAGMAIGNLAFLGLAWCAAASRVEEADS